MNSVDTPDEPIPLLFDGVPNTAEGIAALSDNALRSTRPTNSLGPFLHGIIAEQNRASASAGAWRRPDPVAAGRPSPPKNIETVTAKTSPRPPTAADVDAEMTPRGVRVEVVGGNSLGNFGRGYGYGASPQPLRVMSAPAAPVAAPVVPVGLVADAYAPAAMSGKKRARMEMMRTEPTTAENVGEGVGGIGAAAEAADATAALNAAGASAAPTPAATTDTTPPTSKEKPKAKNPKRADRRRTIARFTTAILRAGGSNAFIARDGLGYRKAFDRFLVETYGETFAEGGYWYENARVEPFFRVLFHIATDGRVQLDHDSVNALFCKREKRQAAEWLLDEEELSKFGVTATQLAQIFEGPPSLSSTGYPRGTPLHIPTDGELDSGSVPRKGAAAAAAAAAATAAQIQAQTAARAQVVRGGSTAGASSHSGGPVGLRGPAPVAHAIPFGAAQQGAHPPHEQTLQHQYSGGIPVAAAVPGGAQNLSAHHNAHPHHPHVPPHAYAHHPALMHPGHGPYAAMGFPPHGVAAHEHEHGAPTMLPPVSLPPGSYAAQPMMNGLYDSRLLDPTATGPRRQYSSDLSRLMSEFNANPSSSDDFLKSFLQRSASELDNLAQMGQGPTKP